MTLDYAKTNQNEQINLVTLKFFIILQNPLKRIKKKERGDLIRTEHTWNKTEVISQCFAVSGFHSFCISKAIEYFADLHDLNILTSCSSLKIRK